MPTVLRIGPYRFFFYSGDGGEPPHIHVERDDHIAKYWLARLRLAKSGDFNRAELSGIEHLVAANINVLQEAWNEYFGA